MTKDQEASIANSCEQAYGSDSPDWRKLGLAKLRAIELSAQIRQAEALERIAVALAGDGDTRGSLLELIADRMGPCG